MYRNAAVLIAVMIFLLAAVPESGYGHCQIPCGIYDDAARIARMYEDATTIEKGMQKINELAGQSDAQSANQLTRWIMNKEAHASNIITIVSEYFLTQKVKPVAPGDEGHTAYLQKLAAHHQLMSAAMKVKQNTDLKYVVALREAIDALAQQYGEKPHQH